MALSREELGRAGDAQGLAATGQAPSRRSRLRAPLTFGAPVTETVLDASVLALPVRGADPALRDDLQRRVEVLAAELPEEARTADAVRRCVVELLPHGEPALAAVARRLAVSQRTLHRRLAAEGTSGGRHGDVQLDSLTPTLSQRERGQ